MITSAPTNSQLAGVLAGFVFTGILILFGRPGPKNTQTLSLFAATFVILGFDSYLFSLISGGDSDPVCSRVWTESMAASGMLAAGATALIGGIRWLLAHHLDDEAEGEVPDSNTVDLDRLSLYMLYGVATAVMLLLAATTLDYFQVVFEHRAPGWLNWLVSLSPLAVGATAVVLTRRRARRTAVDDSQQRSNRATRSLSVTAFGLLVYAVVGPVFAGVLTNLPTSLWSPTPALLIVMGVVIGLVFPAVLLVALIVSAPPISGVVKRTAAERPVEVEGAEQ
ncbi:hypothetical protein ACQEU1_13960 [Lentzea sp. CA-135723]